MAETVILGIDTAAGVSVGLAVDGRVVARRWLDDSRRHVESLLPLLADLLAESNRRAADLTGLAVGMGPGPFTGLRVGIVAAETLAAVCGVPLRHVCSLDVLACSAAEQALAAGEFIASLDARRRELYWARYDAAGRRLEGPVVSAPAALPPLPVTGPGALLYPEAGAGPAAGLTALLAATAGQPSLPADAPSADSKPPVGNVPCALAEERLHFADSLSGETRPPTVAATPTIDAVLAAPGLIRVDAGLLAARVGQWSEAGREPLYLRRPDAALPAARKSVLPSRRPR
ncbi:MAG: tRNA (adenosine(37)-N6)-threonylcarbamoyltransferase complex dimerization subunit type 1 TsaB [Propionibacteriaceae bacterium]|jgi:tRNA threonylcarbamoyl adenosine modification protein YeaZ|nr:tRNA (adenosine(37)-N6)-threonylcarbamoyltransferase complex dimerization subunit type 1 TsaB [Propionibacteriaceae bacterium]